MSSTSDQMTQQNKTRLIIGEIGVDTETGIIGKGHSYDNGKTFVVDDTIYGRIYHADDHGKIWKGIKDKVKTVAEPAKSAADSAYSMASQAVEQANVTKQAQSAADDAIMEAKQGANDAMIQAKSAWDVATGAKEAVTNFDPLLKSSQSDASKAIAQIADTASALSDAKTEFNSGVAEAKNLANTAQSTANNAIKSASSVANDLTAVANQAKANADGITKVTSDVGLLKTTVADNSGNISTIQETAKQIQQAVSDNAGNITVAKQTADSAVAVASDAKSNATVAIQTTSQASITASNASGQAASAVITANGAMTTASDAKSNATVAVQTASGASLTAINAKNDATVAKQTASEAKVQASNAESDFAQLSIRAGKIEASVANNSGAIASVQQTANGLTTTVGNVDDRVKKIEDNTNWTTKTGALDMDTLTTTQNIYYRDTNLKNADGETGWAYIQVVSTGERVTQTVWHDRSSIQHTRTGAINSQNSNYDWDAWNEVATNAQVVEVKNTVDGIATTINDPKTGINATYQTASGNATTISNVKSDVYQLETTANGLTSRVGNLESKTSTQETAIEQNKNAITLKADQTDVDTLKGNVTSLQAESTTQADEIKNRVTRLDVTGMLTGYATQTYTQTQIKQTADSWNANLASVKDGLTQSYTNLSATVDGIKAQVYNSDGTSKITQLSNLIATKVSQGDYNSQINQLSDAINLRVKSADLISQINLQAGATLIQSNKLVLDAKTTVFTGDAFIPSAAIADLTADDITTGTLKGIDIDFRNSSGQGVLIKDSTITFDDGASGNKAGYLSFSSMPIADWPSGTGGNELQIRYGESLAIVATGDTNSRALFSTANTQIGYHQQGNSSSDWGLTGLKIDNSAQHFNLGVWSSDSKWSRVEAIQHNIHMQSDDAHAWLGGNNFHIYKDNDNGSATATELQVDGWAWVRGWVEAAGHSQHSALSTKTDIQPVDDDKMLKMVNDTDLASFLFNADVASGKTHRHIGLIIDDVHDVAQYQAPQDFIAPNGVSRDDDNMIGALFGAVKALTKRIKTLESKVG